MKRTTTEKNIPLCLGVHYFFCGLSPENSSQLHDTFIHHISLSILAPASSSATNKVGHPATYVPGPQNEEIVPRLLSIALCATSSCYAHNAAKSAHHRNAETPWTLRRDVDFFRIKSQKHQDGALAYIFQNIGVTNKFYVEFGFNADNFEGGSGANSYVLHKHFGWKGLLLDGQHENPAINLHKEFILPENIASIFRKHNVPKEPDFVSIDIDSYDIWLFKALVTGGFRPRVLTVEYNAFPPSAVEPL